MTRQTVRVVLVAALVLLAGCAGGISGSPGGAATDASSTDAASGDATTGGGTVAFYLSDEENAIGDFRYLNVTVTRVGFERADGDGWVERDIDNETVDLTELRGANATLVDEYDVPNGTYSKVFVHVSEVNATLQNGEQVRVKLPSEKLQLTNEFTVDGGSEVNFVFDIAVHKAGNSGKYILKPVVSESGTDVPIDRVDDDAELNATFVGEVTQGENATVRVMQDGEPVENATVVVNGADVGTTDADGELTFEVPSGEELEVAVTAGDAETELETEFEASEDDDDDADDAEGDDAEADAELNATFVGEVTQGENTTVRAMRNGDSVENATVVVNGADVGTTDADGELTFEVPSENSLTVTVRDDDEEVELEREFESDG